MSDARNLGEREGSEGPMLGERGRRMGPALLAHGAAGRKPGLEAPRPRKADAGKDDPGVGGLQWLRRSSSKAPVWEP